MSAGPYPNGPGGTGDTDSPDQGPHVPRIPNELLAAYRSTEIQVRVGVEWMPWNRMGDGPTGVRRDEVFHVITAYNPLSRPRSLEENQAAHRELEAVLAHAGTSHRPAVNRAPDGDWEEPGFAVEGLSREEARELGRRFGQHAVFEIQGNELRIVACFEKRVLRAGDGT